MAQMPAIYEECDDGPFRGQFLQYFGEADRWVEAEEPESFTPSKPLIKPRMIAHYKLTDVGGKCKWKFQGWMY